MALRVRGKCPNCGTKIEARIDMFGRLDRAFDRMHALFGRMERLFRRAFP